MSLFSRRDKTYATNEPDRPPSPFRRVVKNVMSPAFSNVADRVCENNASRRLAEFKKRPKYKLYSAIPLILITFIVLFILSIRYRGDQAILVLRNDEIISNLNDNIKEKEIQLNRLNTNPTLNLNNITTLQEELNKLQNELKDVMIKNDNYIYYEKISDKTIDLFTGLIASTLMIYVGSASIRFYQLRRDAENDTSCY